MIVELRSGERGSSRGARRIYTGLVAGQVALACTLLVSSALLVRTVTRMVNTPTGVDADNVVTASVQLIAPDGAPFSPDAQWRTFADQHTAILDHIRRESGIEAAGATSNLPLEIASRFAYEIDGDTPRRADDRLGRPVPDGVRRVFRIDESAAGDGPRVHAVRHRHLGAGGDRQRNVPESSSRQRPPGDRPTPDDQRPDRRSARQEPPGAVSTASIERQPAAGRVRDRRRRQGHTKRAARSGLWNRPSISARNSFPIARCS